jgi:hypothetical protein
MNTYQDFLKGRFQGISLSREGKLYLAPALEAVFSSDQPVIWSIARAENGTLYAGTGHRGRVFEIDKSGKSSVVFSSDQPEVFAVALDRKGSLYVATSPDGKVYRVEKGKATEYFAPKTKYIWALAPAPDGTLYVGTGDQGRIYRVEGPGKGEVYYETGQSHVTSLALDGKGQLLAGTEPNGILYRIHAKDKAFVLCDSNLPEIRAIVAGADGAIYAAALGGSVAKQSQAAQAATQGSGSGSPPAVSTTVTVTADVAAAQAEIKPPEPPKPAAAPAASAQAQPQVNSQFSPVVDMTGVEKSAVLKIHPDNTVETLWSSKEENVYDLLPVGDGLLLATDRNGRVYRLSGDRKASLVLQTDESEATRLLTDGSSVLAATGNLGKILRMGDATAAAGVFESPVHDVGTVARWGLLSWRAEPGGASQLVFRTRSGNSSRPDKTWSDWSGPLSRGAGSAVTSPNARYVQWKAEFAKAGQVSPILQGVTLAYLPQNTAPAVKSIQVVVQLSASGTAPKPVASAAAGVYSVTVTDTGEAGPSTSAGTPSQTPTRAGAQQISVTWQAEDPDGDRLVYSLYFRGEDETEWKRVKADTHDTTVALDGDAFADGRYFFRVTASDREVNAAASARDAELVSVPVALDNTPPAVKVTAATRSGLSTRIDFETTDATSPLRRCEYSVDAGHWIPVEAADGVVDSQHEVFSLRLENFPPGERTVVLRAVDAANNVGLTKVVLR